MPPAPHYTKRQFLIWAAGTSHGYLPELGIEKTGDNAQLQVSPWEGLYSKLPGAAEGKASNQPASGI